MPPKKSKNNEKEDKFIILKNINPIKLIYEHILINNTNNVSKDQPIELTPSNDNENIFVEDLIQDVEIETSITDILKESSMAYTLFTDIRKNNIKSWPILISEQNSKENNLFNKLSFDYNKPTKIKCWWCKNSFDSFPLGIPIKKEKNIIFMEGVICSFPCAKSYIKNCEGLRYKDSMTILNYLYDIFKKSQNPINYVFTEIPDAPHWNQLKEFGGHLTIEEFRSTFGKIKYTKTSNILLVSYPILFNERCIATSPQKR